MCGCECTRAARGGEQQGCGTRGAALHAVMLGVGRVVVFSLARVGVELLPVMNEGLDEDFLSFQISLTLRPDSRHIELNLKALVDEAHGVPLLDDVQRLVHGFDVHFEERRFVDLGVVLEHLDHTLFASPATYRVLSFVDVPECALGKHVMSFKCGRERVILSRGLLPPARRRRFHALDAPTASGHTGALVPLVVTVVVDTNETCACCARPTYWFIDAFNAPSASRFTDALPPLILTVVFSITDVEAICTRPPRHASQLCKP
mmetsp:Transcript_34349/g.108245  ORF Transcript_34349/g.108245 Transcript_34349/m.108245 type:complete len:262 (+) Transcript_34349:262-1047(+)